MSPKTQRHIDKKYRTTIAQIIHSNGLISNKLGKSMEPENGKEKIT